MSDLRQDHYFLNYVPNIVTSQLIESIEKNDREVMESVLQKLVLIKLLPDDYDILK